MPAALGVCDEKALVTRADWIAAYRHLTVDDLAQAARWTRTTGECHQVSMVLTQVTGPKPMRPTTEQARVLIGVHNDLNRRRRQLAEAEKTAEELAADHARREAEVDETRRITDARRRAGREAYATDKARRGGYLMPHERDWLRTPA